MVPAAAAGRVTFDTGLVSEAQRQECATNPTAPLQQALREVVVGGGVEHISLAPNVVVAGGAGGGGGGTLSGYVARVSGAAPASSNVVRALATNAGRGVSWFAVTQAVLPSKEAELARFAALSEELSAGAAALHVTHAESRENFDDATQYIVVRGAPAAAALDATAFATLHALATSAEYARARADARTARTAAATEFAQRLGLASTAAPLRELGSLETHAAAPLRGSAGNTTTYMVYNNVYDASEARAGAPVFHGSLAGYTLYAGARHNDDNGQPSLAWSNETEARAFSMVPADSGLAATNSARARAIHAAASATLAKHAERRLAWSGGAYNPPATAAYYDRDAEWLRAATALGAGPAAGSVSATPLVVVCAHLPPFDTSRFALPALLHVAATMGERTLPVHLDNPVLGGGARARTE